MPQSGIGLGTLENSERLKSRELDGMSEPYLGIRNASSKLHRFCVLMVGDVAHATAEALL